MATSTGSRRSWHSHNSILSIASEGSILSIGSAYSVLSIGSVGSVLSFGSAGSFASALSSASFGSVGSAFSHLSRWSLMASRGNHVAPEPRPRLYVVADENSGEGSDAKDPSYHVQT